MLFQTWTVSAVACRSTNKSLALDSSAWAIMAVEGALKQVSQHGREVVEESREGNEVG